ncbi:hypothetical protein [Haliea sp.]|uniref:IS66 family insertion sequence element accessory protein TnpA n=1 Tax=Haliea sp. TaxID=1932666 RepID=UPI0035282826
MTDTAEDSLTERQQYWLQHIKACEAAGVSSKAYADSRGLCVKALYSARKELARKGVLSRPSRHKFQRVEIFDSTPIAEGLCQIQLPNGVSVSIRGDVGSAILTQVLTVAASLS